jgi:hypothetical protein
MDLSPIDVSPDQRPLYIIPPRGGVFSDEHQHCARTVIARHLAGLTGSAFAGDFSGEVDSAVEPYFLPADTLTGEEARRYGIDGEEDLFGGVVPCDFVASKAISHCLVSEDAAAPPEWNRQFSDAIADVVLPGFTVFSREDAETGAKELLRNGPVQLKATGGFAGFGQEKIASASDLDVVLDEQDWDNIGRKGLVLEQRLENISASSVGQVKVGGITASYYALQKEVSDENRDNIYVGSALLVVRGDFDDLLSLDLSEGERSAIRDARKFDAAVDEHFEGFFASRRNYDVIRGFDPDGRPISGVLEQSWRIGGATAAEVLALEAFTSNPGLDRVKCRTVEVFGELADVPDDALLLYRGVDPKAGPITRYAVSER